jgi:hypothetical protein
VHVDHYPVKDSQHGGHGLQASVVLGEALPELHPAIEDADHLERGLLLGIGLEVTLQTFAGDEVAVGLHDVLQEPLPGPRGLSHQPGSGAGVYGQENV